MLRRRLYYDFKPFLPWRLRIAVRRMLAARLRRRHQATWPIDERIARTPEGWPGWPESRQFAFVVTHDVEGPGGLAKVRSLAELEMRYGIRSSFNFIPQGGYAVPEELRSWLTANGFEVGVHDLHHDGKLYRSRRVFQKRAEQINRHLRAWGAVGYRSGFMLRNLDWHHDLDVLYDASTFDTDPFEFQPDGAGTIFPFWLEAPERKEQEVEPRGYVELPYTLPQDSTLFLVLREKGPDIWIRKTDWLVRQGGMVLVNVHPDYLRFPGEDASPRTFPVDHYEALLRHVQTRHAGRCWHALPKDVAAFAARVRPRKPHKPKRVCMITHSFYENDNRVTRYAEALAERGDHVDVLSLRRSATMPRHEVVRGVAVHRIQDRFGKKEQSKAAYVWPWMRFLIATSWWIARAHLRRRYDLLHVHNMPDFLAFAALLPRLTGARVLLDIHDIVPEFYASKFAAGHGSFIARLLKWQERASARLAHHVIISNHLWLSTYSERTATQQRCSVFINNVDTRVFRPVPRTRDDGKLIVIFPGGLQWHQGLDIALRAFAQVREALPEAEFHIYGEGIMKPALVALSSELGLNGSVRFFEPVGVRDIARVMANADLGVVPKRADSFGNEAYSTKIMEFMSVGVPVVVSSTKIDRYYFDDSVVRFFESGNVNELARAMKEVLGSADLRRSLVTCASDYSRRHSWESRKGDYLRLVDTL